MTAGERPRIEPEPAVGTLERPNYDTVMLVATVVSALASVIMPTIQMVIT